jgi:hypothetical protein
MLGFIWDDVSCRSAGIDAVLLRSFIATIGLAAPLIAMSSPSPGTIAGMTLS